MQRTIIQVYTFRNIRYAAPPVGNSRWAKPSPPEVVHDIQDGSYGHNCFPVPLPGFDTPAFANVTLNPGEGMFHAPESPKATHV